MRFGHRRGTDDVGRSDRLTRMRGIELDNCRGVRSWAKRAVGGLTVAGLMVAGLMVTGLMVTALMVGGLIAAAMPTAAQASARVAQTEITQTEITTTSAPGPARAAAPPLTTVITVRSSPGPASGAPTPGASRNVCPPGNRVPNLCELVPSRPKRARRRGTKPRPPAANPPSAATAPTSASATPPTAGTLPSLSFPYAALPVSPLQTAALDFLLGAFPVPPFLLPIYHEAGADYGVPWQVLAAINEIETDYGRNLSTSSAGAVGWMQFLPSTWARFGIDADGGGSADPYDPVDAIFSAARYLRAAGATHDLSGAIFAYNHATWYVNSVKLRARLLQFLPQRLVDVLTGLMQARFPIGGHLGRFARQLPSAVRLGGQPGVILTARPGAPVVAVADGRVVSLGDNRRLGRYLTLEDSYGDRFTYGRLGAVATAYPVLRPRVESASRIERALDAGLSGGAGRSPQTGASGGAERSLQTGASGGAGRSPQTGASGGAETPPATKLLASVDTSSSIASSAPGRSGAKAPSAPARTGGAGFAAMAKERLFARPWRPASYAAGGLVQLESEGRAGPKASSDYYAATVGLTPGDYALEPLTRGSVVLAGTILGRTGRAGRGKGQIAFQIRPAGAGSPVDPAPIVAGWQVLGRLTAGRASVAGAMQAGAYGAQNPWVGQLLMARRSDLERSVLADRRVVLDRCARRAIQGEVVDRRVLAAIEYLSYDGLAPAVSGIACPLSPASTSLPQTVFSITRIAGLPVTASRAAGPVDLAIRQLLVLQGELRPSLITSARRYPWEPATATAPGAGGAIRVSFTSSDSPELTALPAALDTREWTRLISRLAGLGTGSAASAAPAASAASAGSAPSAPSVP